MGAACDSPSDTTGSDLMLMLAGLYILPPKIFEYLEERISNNVRDDGNFQFSPALDRLRQLPVLAGAQQAAQGAEAAGLRARGPALRHRRPAPVLRDDHRPPQKQRVRPLYYQYTQYL